MVAVGCLYIKSKEAPAKAILKDLVELCKGVQHPTRGLFLRSYLCQRSKGLLPDSGSEYEGDGGTIDDALDFLLTNFIEMNKLWVRMQHQGSARDKEKREKERQQLQDLVGKNLTYLSQLDGLDYDLYNSQVSNHPACSNTVLRLHANPCICHATAYHVGGKDEIPRAHFVLKNAYTEFSATPWHLVSCPCLIFPCGRHIHGLPACLQVLPRVMEQIVSCKDDLAQQYLFQCVIQCFPDAFHLGTLDALLGALPELQPGVKVSCLHDLGAIGHMHWQGLGVSVW